MPRGKRTVFAGTCSVCKRRVTTTRLHKQKDGVSWKDFKISKYCATCKKRTPIGHKEERHSK